MRSLILALPLLIAVSATAGAFEQTDVGLGSLPPIDREYKARIAKWSRGFYSAPRAVQAAQLSDPVLIRDGTGRLVWLVCFEAVNAAPGARAEPERFAFGFAPNFVSVPLERRGATLLRSDCDERPLAWRPFRELSRL